MKKIIFAFLIIVMCICQNPKVMALTTLNEVSTKSIINSGTTKTTYKRLTDKGWLNINIVEVDLKDSDTNITVLTSKNGLSTFQNVKTMFMDNKNTIVAINADFFNGKTNKGNIVGMTIKDGEMLTSTYYENETKNTLASFVLDEEGKAKLDYFSNKITLANLKSDVKLPIGEINKWSSNYEYPVIYTSEWGNSIGNTLGIELTELVIKDGKVSDIRIGKDPIKIPANGYVVSCIGEPANIIKNSFDKKSKVKLDIDVGLDIDKVKTAISGGTLLVKDGQIAKFTHNISGSQPRTAIGLSKDEKTLYLITIDGRQKSSIGVSQEELAQILIEKNIYTAINLDGGGSTTLITRRLGDEEPTIENSPSDKALRNVPNSLAIVNTNKTSTLDKLLIEVDDVNVFVGCKKELIVKGYDKYYNPVQIDKNKIKWSYEGVPVSVDGLTLIGGNEAGNTILTASIGKAKCDISIDVLSMPNELTITPKKVEAGKNEIVNFKVSGQNKNGYFANLKNDEVIWEVLSGDAKIKDGKFEAKEAGNYIVSVSCGNATSYALVCVGATTQKLLYDFEDVKFTSKVYPEEVTGSAKLSDEEVYAGKLSGKLTYDFTTTDKTRASYLRFDEPINIPNGAEEISVMTYTTISSNDQIKLKIYDANGKVNYKLLGKGLESSGWQELKLNLEGILLPAKLSDIYVAQDDAKQKTAGTIYFDELKMIAPGSADEDIKMPKDIKGADQSNVKSELETSNAFGLIVAPNIDKPALLMDNLKNKNLENIINKNSEVCAFTTGENMQMLTNINSKKITPTKYLKEDYKCATIISLDVSNGGLRLSDSMQWLNLKRDIKLAQKNVLIVMNGSLEDFIDEEEKKLFIDVLCELKNQTNKNIWVIQKGEQTNYSMKRGVKYLSISDFNYDASLPFTQIENANYIEIVINETKMTYEIKNIYK